MRKFHSEIVVSSDHCADETIDTSLSIKVIFHSEWMTVISNVYSLNN